jgi:hypothetical protein
MNVSKLSLVPLQRASLCLDCEIITVAHTHCLACGSAALLNLARTLNGDDATSMHSGLAEVVSISARRRFESQRSESAEPRHPHRFPEEGMKFAAMSGQPCRERTRSHGGDLLREIAAAFYRAMPLSLLGILVLAATVA